MIKVVNFFAGPGAGKSTTAAALFSELKYLGINCEYVTEFAKDLTWEDRGVALRDQVYVFGEQYHKIYRLINKVDLVITDSPLLLSMIYTKTLPKSFYCFVYDAFNQFDNINYVIERKKPYNPAGRNQTVDQAKELDSTIKELLRLLTIPYTIIPGTKNVIKPLVTDIINQLGGKVIGG